ncbi:hypothetical protein SLEP1_g7081 [Rubroshorea leprosula]|uniref:Proteasome component Ecm29 N-terminal domain-containing protein n=1 Tax=Rubroshorea leprosula TaxID=152421 RepID=A0AAV5I826_9ROSI|nr:hypothetical protein SLEP1_g7081 [Rubroshorea leprosula]
MAESSAAAAAAAAPRSDAETEELLDRMLTRLALDTDKMKDSIWNLELGLIESNAWVPWNSTLGSSNLGFGILGTRCLNSIEAGLGVPSNPGSRFLRTRLWVLMNPGPGFLGTRRWVRSGPWNPGFGSALCDDSKLEALLSKLLPLTISSLSSQSLAVRNKVLEILSHVNKRVKHQPEIGLPLMDLWKMYSELNASPMVKNFSIIYIEMAFEWINLKEKENMAPMLLANISKLPQQHQEIIMRIAVKVIGECHASCIDEEVAAKYRVLNDPQEREIFLEFCLHVILYQPPSQGGGCPPGLSLAQANRVMGKLQLKGDLLMIRKLGILNVIETMELALELVYPLYLAACAVKNLLSKEGRSF